MDCTLPVCFVKPHVYLLQTCAHKLFLKVYIIIAVYHYYIISLYTTILTVTLAHGLLTYIATVAVVYAYNYMAVTSPCQLTIYQQCVT